MACQDLDWLCSQSQICVHLSFMHGDSYKYTIKYHMALQYFSYLSRWSQRAFSTAIFLIHPKRYIFFSQFPKILMYSKTKKLIPGPAWPCPCAQSQLHAVMACQEWRVLTLTPLKTLGMNWNWLHSSSPCPMLTDALVIQWTQISATFQNITCGREEVIITANEGQSLIRGVRIPGIHKHLSVWGI